MSYNDVNIDYRKKYDFLLKKQKSQSEFIAFEKKLQSKTQDDCFTDEQREKRFKRESAKVYDFVHTLSYNKAIGAISRADEKQLFQGSSFNRKKTEKKPKTEKNSIDLVNQLEKQPKKEKTTSNRTKDKIKEKMLSLYRTCSGLKGNRSHIVNFTLCTLTFINEVSDTQGIIVLNKFFTALRDRYRNFEYIWVAEKQENGNIHFHIILNIRLDLFYCNSLWVIQQINSGIHHYENEAKLKADWGCSPLELHNTGDYKAMQKYFNPVDLKPVKTIDGISCYLTNYVTKNKSKFLCSSWHCSRSVSKLFTRRIIDRNTFDKTSDSRRNRIKSKKTGKEYINSTYVGQYCIINTIYNKSYYRHYLDDMELINKYILKAAQDDNLDTELIQKSIFVDNIEYRKQFLEKLNPIFETN